MDEAELARYEGKAVWLNREARAAGLDAIYTVTRDGLRCETKVEQRLRVSKVSAQDAITQLWAEQRALLLAKLVWINREARDAGEEVVYSVVDEAIYTESYAEYDQRMALGKGDNVRTGGTDTGGKE